MKLCSFPPKLKQLTKMFSIDPTNHIHVQAFYTLKYFLVLFVLITDKFIHLVAIVLFRITAKATSASRLNTAKWKPYKKLL